jgi:calcineurin-like phosphoesterase
MILEKGTAYQTDAGMCGDYNSVIGMNKENSLNRFMKKKSVYRTDINKNFPAEGNKNFPAEGEASLCGLIVECDVKTGLANRINQFIYGGELKNSQQ